MTSSGTVATDADVGTVAAMLGRPPRGEIGIAARCHLGLPTVVRVPPILPDGEPFPTLYWLTCPLAVRRIGKLESQGMIKKLQRRVSVDEANRQYAAERDRALAQRAAAGSIDADAPVPTGGVGGAVGGIKCLHAHFAYWLVGGNDPVGARTARYIGTLDCSDTCVDAGRVDIRRPGAGIGPEPEPEG